MTGDGTVQQVLNGGHLPLPPNKIRLSTPDSAMLLTHAQQAMGHDWFLGTLNAHHLRITNNHCAIDQSCGGRAEHHPARWSYRLHPLRHSDLLTNRGVTQSARTDFTGDHLT